MTRPAVLFRGDASHAIGFGHVARLCALIEALDPSIEPVVMFGGDPGVAAWARAQGIAAHARSSSQPWTPADVLAAAPHVRAVVIDGPVLADQLVPQLAAGGARTLVIDDRGDCALPVDTIVNHNLHAPALAATYPHARLCLLGRRYLLLRRAIRRHAHGACQPRDGARLRVVITFGGSDPVGATARTLRLLPAERPLDLAVLLGPGFRDHAHLALAAATARASGHAVDLLADPPDPATLFASADAAICSAGGTLGELAYLGCPAFALAIVPDQLAPAAAAVSASVIACGLPLTSPDATLRAALLAFLTDAPHRLALRAAALATADASGPHRILAEALA